MTTTFTGDDLNIVLWAFQEVEEIITGVRKGEAQGRYVILVEGTYVDVRGHSYEPKPIPLHLAGHWKSDEDHFVEYDTVDDMIKKISWVKCKQVEVKTTEWV